MKDTLEQKQQTFRERNLEKAREARRIKLTAEKLAVIKKEVEEVAETVDDKIEEAIAGKIRAMADDVRNTQDKIKLDFLKVFYAAGGIKELLKWIKLNPLNRKEYYKLLVGLIKAEIQTPGGGNQQVVQLNIIAPKEVRGEVVDGE